MIFFHLFYATFNISDHYMAIGKLYFLRTVKPNCMKFLPGLLIFLYLAPLFLYAGAPPNSRQYVSDYENVIGTSMELKVSTTSPAAAEKAQKAVLHEIGRLSAILAPIIGTANSAGGSVLPMYRSACHPSYSKCWGFSTSGVSAPRAPSTLRPRRLPGYGRKLPDRDGCPLPVSWHRRSPK